MKTIFYAFTLLIHKILFSPLKDKIHIFMPPCNTSNIYTVYIYIYTYTVHIQYIHVHVHLYTLDYCNSLLYNIPKYVHNKLQFVQNAAARLITCSRKYDHITPILIDLHWLPIAEHIKFKILLLTFKALYEQSPIYIKNLVTRYSPTRSLCSSSALRLNRL